MPNHWHLVVWPWEDGELSRFVGWVTLTHTQRWHAWHRTAGTGHLYQGRFKSFPIQEDFHLQVVCRYVERNPLRAALVPKARDWRWGSLWCRRHPRQAGVNSLAQWPVPLPDNWESLVNEPLNEPEALAVRTSLARNRPFGDLSWQVGAANALGLTGTLRARGRPKKGS